MSAFEEPAAAGKSEFKLFVLYGNNYFEKGIYLSLSFLLFSTFSDGLWLFYESL